MRFEAAPEYQVFPTKGRPLKPYAAVVRAAAETQPLVRELEPHAVVSDILTLAPALAAELENRPWATLVPHVYPPPAEGLPPYGFGGRLPRSGPGRALWRRLSRAAALGLERGRVELNETRRRVGLPALAHVHGGISRQLCLVGTFPQLEYPRAWPPRVHVTGPLLWEPPAAEVEHSPGEEPLVVVAPSTSQDPHGRLLAASLDALASLPVRVLAIDSRGERREERVPANARVVEWAPYSRTMPRADLVICHGGHGTLAWALAGGAPVVVVPAVGDMAENGARAQWAGVGLCLPGRLLSSSTLRLVIRRVLEDSSFGARAHRLQEWAASNDGPEAGAHLVERFAVSPKG